MKNFNLIFLLFKFINHIMFHKISKKWTITKTISEDSSFINSLIFSNYKPFFFTGNSDSNIRIWDAENFRQISILKGSRSSINKIIMDEKSGNLISASEDKNIISWNTEYEKILRKFRGHKSGVTCLSIHPTLNLLASGSRDNTVRIWDLRVRKELVILKQHQNEITSVIFNQETPHLVSSSRDSKICLWDMIAFRCKNFLILHPYGIKETKLHPTEFMFASLCSGLLCLWRADGHISWKSIIFKDVKLFSFKNCDELVTLKYSGWIRFYKKKRNSGQFYSKYGFSPFNRKQKRFFTAMEFNHDYSTLVLCDKMGKIVVFKRKWFFEKSIS